MSKMTKEEAALLDAIARTESAGDWNVIYGGSKFDDYSKHPAKFVTITSGPNKGKKSSAAGKYQITKTTYDAVAPKLGITDFSPESQQKIALYLAREKYGPDLARDLAAGKAADAAAKLAGVWTSLPGGIEAGTNSNKFLKSYAAALDAPRPPGFIPDVASEIDIGGGTDVRTYQQQLADRGFSPGTIDGVRGPKTIAAVKQFQLANGLTVDGIVGRQTLGALNATGSTQPTDLLDALKARASGVPQAAIGVTGISGTKHEDITMTAPVGDMAAAFGAGVDDRLMKLAAPPASRVDPIGDGPKSWFPEGTDLVAGLKARAAALAPSLQETRAEQAQMRGRGAGFDPLPAPAPLVAPAPTGYSPTGETLPGATNFDGSPVQVLTKAPTPMPGRPASLSVAPPKAPTVAPVTPSGEASQGSSVSTSATAGQALVRLPSGKMIAPGTYPTKSGSVTITDDGSGGASIKNNYKGFVDLGSEMNADTVLGGIIRSKIAEAVPAGLESAASNFAPAVQGAQTAATNAIEQVAPVVDNLKSGIGGAFSNVLQMFGGPRLQNAAVAAPTLNETMAEQAQLRGRPPRGPSPAAVVAPAYKIGQIYQSKSGPVVFNGSGFQPVAPTPRYGGPNVVDEVGALRYHG